MNLYLGIEGGGTRTVAAVSDESGHILGRGEAGPANPVKVGLPQAKRTLLLAARAAPYAHLPRRLPGHLKDPS